MRKGIPIVREDSIAHIRDLTTIDPRIKFTDDGGVHHIKITGSAIGANVEIDGHPVYARHIKVETGEDMFSTVTLEIPGVTVEVDVRAVPSVEHGPPDDPAWFHCSECGKGTMVAGVTCHGCTTEKATKLEHKREQSPLNEHGSS